MYPFNTDLACRLTITSMAPQPRPRHFLLNLVMGEDFILKTILSQKEAFSLWNLRPMDGYARMHATTDPLDGRVYMPCLFTFYGLRHAVVSVQYILVAALGPSSSTHDKISTSFYMHRLTPCLKDDCLPSQNHVCRSSFGLIRGRARPKPLVARYRRSAVNRPFVHHFRSRISW